MRVVTIRQRLFKIAARVRVTCPRAFFQRKYEHIKESSLDRGRSEARAKEVAARTVNKQRREEGRTPNQTTQGTGNPNTNLDDRTVNELRNLAKQMEIEGRSQMKKAERIQAIRNRR